MKKNKIGYYSIISLAFIAILGMFFLSPIIQNEDYHNFSDTNTIFNIPNFWNVISNIPFLIVGVLGLFKLKSITNYKAQYLIFFLGVSLVSFGSSYYHLYPTSDTLIWDRLPMTIAFMALFSIIISEFINREIGQKTLIPALIIGGLSVLYWVVFKDLRFYALVQFYPLLAIPVILVFYKSKYNLTSGYWMLLIAYVIAKILEHFDSEIHNFLTIISGHSLKHIAAAVGIFILLNTYLKRAEK
ncbi:MAG: alkaline phytoceramidase [Lutibacter sp.]|uniref:ceramidase domain-containing protein n=1 Tax=Lutibacter sp. TaxID=1925666 RepID=UPI001A01C685|nr:ceramidase domain-containing protein [Lutibacter sp.]NOR29041.1 alkaline phytoceramidase [Lutibacter sp.]